MCQFTDRAELSAKMHNTELISEEQKRVGVFPKDQETSLYCGALTGGLSFKEKAEQGCWMLRNTKNQMIYFCASFED